MRSSPRPIRGTLGALVAAARDRAAALPTPVGAGPAGDPAAPASAPDAEWPRPPSLLAALRRGSTVAVIAEIKRRSPSRGVIAPDLDPATQAAAYARGGAAAISVLTEPTAFGGSMDDLVAARGANVPLLCKDFIVHPAQIAAAAAHGASAVLLLARVFWPDELAELYMEAYHAGLEAIVEIHDEDDLETASGHGYPIVGVNSRDLETLREDPAECLRLVTLVPASVCAVYESGVRTRDDVERAAAAGADAVLVGTSLSGHVDPAGAVRALAGVARRGRGGQA